MADYEARHSIAGVVTTGPNSPGCSTMAEPDPFMVNEDWHRDRL